MGLVIVSFFDFFYARFFKFFSIIDFLYELSRFKIEYSEINEWNSSD